MKKILFLAIAACLIFMMVSCGKEKGVVGDKGNLEVRSFTYTDCKEDMQIKARTDTTSEEFLELKADGNYLKIKHVNAEFNCCPEEFLISSKVSNDTIFIDEKEKAYSCNCTCYYDLNYEVGKLDYGKYYVVYMNYPFIEFDLDFNSNTDEIINLK